MLADIARIPEAFDACTFGVGQTARRGLAALSAGRQAAYRGADTVLDIWLVHTGEPLPGAGGEMHVLPLGRKLAGRGNRVLWWITSFDLFSKQWTFRSDSEMVI